MCRINTVAYIISIIMLFLLGGIAWGQCTASDGNNDAAHAHSVGLSEVITDWVCPDDPFDFYAAEIPPGVEISGRITFQSPQPSTVLRVEHEDTGTRIVPDWSTNETRSEFTVPITPGDIPAGRYIIRVSFWSDAAYDHEYTLTIDLTAVGGDECVPDGNEDPATSVEIAYDTTVEDWLCADDHVDIWHFSVTDGGEGNGTITLMSNPGELILYLYDSSATELFRERTDGGTAEYSLGASGSPLPNGEYYIGVFLPMARTDENSYSLQLRSGLHTMLPAVMEMAERLPEDPLADSRAPWPMEHGNRYNAGLSSFDGPAGVLMNTVTFDSYRLNREEMETHHRKYNNLIVGAHNRAFFMSALDREIIALNTSSGEVEWEAHTLSFGPPCLGKVNDIYFIDMMSRSLVCANASNGDIYWSQPYERGDAHLAVKMVGTHVYTAASYPWGGSEPLWTSVQAWDIGDGTRPWTATGDMVWQAGPLAGYINGIIEDMRGYVYIQTHLKLYKYDLDGRKVWEQELPDPRDYDSELGPVLDPRGRVWVHYYRSPDYVVFNKDGSVYEEGSYDFRRIRAACFDHRGRIYVADEEKVFCYNDYDELVWEAEIDGPYIDDMALGRNDRLYISRMGKPSDYVADMIVLDVEDGSEINRFGLEVHTEAIDVIEAYGGSWHGSSIAIGEGNKVIVLQRSGILEVIGPLTFRMYTMMEAK